MSGDMDFRMVGSFSRLGLLALFCLSSVIAGAGEVLPSHYAAYIRRYCA